MVEDIYKGMKKAYTMGKMVIGMREMFAELDKEKGGEGDGSISAYDFRLLSVYFTDWGDEEDKSEHRLLEVRVRTPKPEDQNPEGYPDDCEEELVLVFNSYGARKPVEDIDNDLEGTAEIIENYTEDFIAQFPDVELRWDFMGDTEDDGGEE